jgi:hypothetical protein
MWGYRFTNRTFPIPKMTGRRWYFPIPDITYLQQKWISFLLAFLVNKNENNFEDSMT